MHTMKRKKHTLDKQQLAALGDPDLDAARRKAATKERLLTNEGRAWLRGFATALISIWELHHDGQMVAHVITANGIDLNSLRDSGIDPDAYAKIVKAVNRGR